jgi:hypothetical protein
MASCVSGDSPLAPLDDVQKKYDTFMTPHCFKALFGIAPAESN